MHFMWRGDEGEVVSYLLFANDTLSFCETSQDQLIYLNWLMWFEATSSLKINLKKNEVIPIGRVDNMGGVVP